MAFLAKSTASISQVSFSLAPPSSQICSAQQLTSPVSCGKLPIDALSVSIPRSSAQILCLKGGIVHRRAPLPKLLASTQSLALQSSLSSSSLRFASSSLVMNHLLGIQGTELVSFMDGVGALDKVRSGARAALSDETLRWTFVAAAMVVMLVRGSSVRKEFVVPLVALELPQDILSYMRGEYGLWAAFLALAVRLFYYIPGELELPLTLLLLVITAPLQVMRIRGTPAASVVSLALASILAYQQFSRSGSISDSFKQGAILTTIAILMLLGIPIYFFMRGL